MDIAVHPVGNSHAIVRINLDLYNSYDDFIMDCAEQLEEPLRQLKWEKLEEQATEKAHEDGCTDDELAARIDALPSPDEIEWDAEEYTDADFVFGDPDADVDGEVEAFFENGKVNKPYFEHYVNLNEEDRSMVLAYAKHTGEDPGEYSTFSNARDSFMGCYNSDKKFAYDLANSMRNRNWDNEWPESCIDWDMAAENIMSEYFESDGYYFRNT